MATHFFGSKMRSIFSCLKVFFIALSLLVGMVVMVLYEWIEFKVLGFFNKSKMGNMFYEHPTPKDKDGIEIKDIDHYL